MEPNDQLDDLQPTDADGVRGGGIGMPKRTPGDEIDETVQAVEAGVDGALDKLGLDPDTRP